ncbi:MAG TPA: glycosyltransferase family 87 protein [Candidatus Dormibacteraeota bacterium]
MDGSGRWRNLGIASGALAAALFAGFDLFQWVAAYGSDHFHNDFTFYYAAARIGVTHGWQSIYDLGLQQSELDAIGSRIKIAELARYISPPPLAWLAVPFTLLPYPIAYMSWSALLLAALAGTWYLGAPGAGPARLIHLVAALAWLPVIYALQLGQPGLFVALGVAGSYALLRKERQFLSGLALGVMVLKPQLGFLLPFALLASGRYRAVAGAAVGIGLLSLASAVSVGPDGIAAYAQRLSFAADVPVNRELTLAFVIGGLAATRLVQGAIAIWALALAYRLRKQPPEWMFVLAILGGLLATPYLHLDDLVMLGLAVWLYLRIPGRPRWSWAFVLALVIAAEGIPEWGPLPFIAGEIAFLVLLSVAALGRQPDHAEHHKVVDAVAVNSRDGRPLR